jgi:hypothetical protein
MPKLVTKDYTVEVALDDEITLVVPSMFANPSVYKRKLSKPTWSVDYWDTKEGKKRKKNFGSPEEAEAFKATAWVMNQELLIKMVTINDILKKPKFFEYYFRIHPNVIEYEHKDVPLDSALLGIWLGDGHSNSCCFTSADKEIADYITQVAKQYDLNVVHDRKYLYRVTANSGRNSNGIAQGAVEAAIQDVVAGKSEKDASEAHGMAMKTLLKYKDIHDRGELEKYFHDRRRNPITEILKSLGIFGAGMKRIPELYLKTSRKVRLGVLAGIIDTDGSLSRESGYDMCFANKDLTDDVADLAKSLGFRCSNVKACMKECTNAAGGSKACQAYRFRICGGDNLMEIPLLLPRKRITKPKTQRYDQLRFKIVTSTPAPSAQLNQSLTIVSPPPNNT